MAKKMVIAGSTVSAQQLKDLFRQIADGGITNLHMQAFLERRNPFVETEPLATTFLTGDYFVTRPGLWVSEEFTSLVTAAYPEVLVPRGLDGVESFDLTKQSSNREIIDQMSEEESVRTYAFTPDQIGALIDLQPGDVAGKLLTNGYVNLFYVVGEDGVLFVVHIDWNADLSQWDVDAWGLDGTGRWGAGRRVFRNTRTF